MLADTVREAARRFGDLVAFVDPDGSPLTYRDLDRRSDHIATGLAEGRRVRPGDRVALRLASDTSYILAYAAAAKLGAVTAGINPRLAPPEQQALVELADPAITLEAPEELAELEAIGTDHQAPLALPTDPTRPIAIVFTSGTTGQPKGAVFTEAQLSAVAQIDTGGAWATSGTPGPAMLASTQFAHIGFMTKLPWYLRLATRTHILGRWRAEDALRTVAEQAMPSIGGVAPQIALMLRSPELDRHDWTHVRTLVMGGAASPPAIVDAARKAFGSAYSIRYSSTESGGCGTAATLELDDGAAAETEPTVGRPRPGIEVTVRDDEGRPVPEDEVGELWLRSPTQMSAYWRDPAGTAATIVDGGWLRTNDLARLDEQGNVILAGRRSEMFIRGGYNVYPAEVEAQLLAHPDVADAAVVPRPDAVMGEIGVAVVVAKDPQSPPELKVIRDFLAARIASYKLPEALHIVDNLPLTPGQKLDRRRLIAEV
jgi:acyl-CoA synthetase (AMP-forming)/AMP-acid ligase II